MLRLLRATTVLGFLLMFLVLLERDYIESAVVEGRIRTPPLVREIVEDARESGLEPQDLLQRRRRAALKNLDEFYQERMDEELAGWAVLRLERQLERSRAKLEENYSLRKASLQRRFDREAGR